MSLGEKIRNMRVWKGLSIKEVSAGTGIFAQRLSRMEDAYIWDEICNVDDLRALSKFYNVSIDDLLNVWWRD